MYDTCIEIIKVKVKITLEQATDRTDLGARRGGWSTSRPGRFTPGKDPVRILKQAVWAPGPVWTCIKIIRRVILDINQQNSLFLN